MKPKYCPFCGSDLGIEIYTEEYVQSLKNRIKQLEDVQENLIGAKEITLNDLERLVTGFVRYSNADIGLIERILYGAIEDGKILKTKKSKK